MQKEIVEMLALRRQRGLACQDLDELVYDTVGDMAASQLNQENEGKSPEPVLKSAEAQTSQINNQGLRAQIEFLLRNHGVESTREMLQTVERESSVL